MHLGPPASDTPGLIGLQARWTWWGLPADPLGARTALAISAVVVGQTDLVLIDPNIQWFSGSRSTAAGGRRAGDGPAG